MNHHLSRRKLLAWATVPLAASVTRLPLFAADTVTSREERIERLMATARNEGPLTLYHLMPPPDVEPIVELYQQRYGLEIEAWKSTGESIIQRVFAETRAGRQRFDILQMSAATQMAFEAGALQEIEPGLDIMLPDATEADHGHWFSTHSAVFAFGYNTNLLQPDQLPSTLEDLADPFWSGKVAFNQGSNAAWIATVYEGLGETRAEAFFTAMAGNEIKVRKGYTLMSNLLAAGEFACTPQAMIKMMENLKQAGAPVDYIPLPPVIALRQVWSLARQSRRPAAATLFFELLAHEGERVFVENNYTSPFVDALDASGNLPLMYADFSTESAENARAWRSRYAQFLRNGLG